VRWDRGIEMPAFQVLTALVLYGAFHSLTAATWWKTRVVALVGHRALRVLARAVGSLPYESHD
jgi:hypothetical protein